jgi:hypothetical protein
VRRTAKKNSGAKPTQTREWRVVLIRSRGEFLGYIKWSERPLIQVGDADGARASPTPRQSPRIPVSEPGGASARCSPWC